MQHSIALVTGATSGLGYAAARLLAGKGYREIIVTGRSLAHIKKTAGQLAEETKRSVFTPLELDLDDPANVQAAVATLVEGGHPIDFLLLNAGLVPYKQRALTAGGVEASQAPLIGHHQLTLGLLHARLLSRTAGGGGQSLPAGIRVRNRRLRAILRFGQGQVLWPNRGAATAPPARSRQPGSRLAGRSQGFRRGLTRPDVDSRTSQERTRCRSKES